MSPLISANPMPLKEAQQPARAGLGTLLGQSIAQQLTQDEVRLLLRTAEISAALVPKGEADAVALGRLTGAMRAGLSRSDRRPVALPQGF